MTTPSLPKPIDSEIDRCSGLHLREYSGRPPYNRIVCGDNLLVMQELSAAFEGRIDLIYVDPPFDVGLDFRMDYNLAGKQTDDAVKIEVVAYRDRWGEGAESYLSRMRQRLALMYQLLSERGALWVHCDYRVNHHLRVMLDELFGQPCVNEIIWTYGAGGNPVSSFPHKHDYLLVYSRSGRILINKDEPIMRVPYDPSTLATHYRTDEETGRLHRRQIKNGKEYITYADQGKLVTDVWTDIGGQTATSPIQSESTGFASQKPERLLERIIAGTTQPDYLVADFFCGSGTTGAVASRLGRRWIMSDFGQQAIHITRQRLLAQGASFALYDLGQAEQIGWQKATETRSPGTYEKTIRNAFEASGNSTSGQNSILVTPPDGLPANAKLATHGYKTKDNGRTKPIVLAWAFDPDLHESVAKNDRAVPFEPVTIPRSLMEIGSPAPTVWQALPQLEVTVRSATGADRRTVTITVEGYDPRIIRSNLKNAEQVSALSRDNGRSFIDLIAVDGNPDLTAPFYYQASIVRNRRDKQLLTILEWNLLEGTIGEVVRVRVIDIFGTTTTVRCPVDRTA